MAKRSVTVAALVAMAAGSYVLLGGPLPARAITAPPAAAPAASPRVGVPLVRLAPAERRDVPLEVQANGTVTPLSSVEIRPHVSRQLTQVHVKEGQFVAANALLFSLDDRAERAALDRTQAQLKRDQAVLADLERQHQRSRELSSQQFISASAADGVQAQAESQRALVQADQAAVRAAQVDLSYTAIRAPSAGRVGEVKVYAGSLVQANAVLASVTQIDPIAVSFTVPEGDVGALLAAFKAGPVAVSAALPDSAIQGRLSFVDSSVDPVAGTIRVKAQFDNRSNRLWPGQYVPATVALATLRNAIVVPLAAIITQTDGALVYAVDEQQSAKPRKVRVLHTFGKLAAVSGVEEGERIIVEGKQNLHPGAKVKPGKDALLADAGSGR
ncbi:RND family efflux transporter, MFP subunit [Duganella sp. CF402]|uniref:efflux RND transporter periplasmic adaptor subunit n=1 Tax=unclassified Duganella TaxID=2636909 RepID=UPI0008C16ED0|nr:MULTISPECIES: efflux RND transporter periplasmic adaptor subunit [unclassified Duganella]RZT04477.1 RND family efflux transporter MFP subunit [Duganella sp. BK701]SEM35072.1 RND family efflux transporter, MFP subunit [Duganella sp. CF402]